MPLKFAHVNSGRGCKMRANPTFNTALTGSIKSWTEVGGQYDQRFKTFFDQLEAALASIAPNLTVFLLKLARVSYVVMAIVGLMFWTSHYNRRTGIEMIVGSVILAVAAEAIFPAMLGQSIT